MNKIVRNIGIGAIIGTLAAGGYYLSKRNNDKNLTIIGLGVPKTEKVQIVPEPEYVYAIKNDDGSVDFKKNIPENYDYEKHNELPDIIEVTKGIDGSVQDLTVIDVTKEDDGSIRFRR